MYKNVYGCIRHLLLLTVLPQNVTRIFFSFIRGSTCTTIVFYISPLPFFLSSFFHFLSARGSSLEIVTAAILSYAVSHLHEGKNDLPLSVSICRPQIGGHPSKYWPSAKLLDLGGLIGESRQPWAGICFGPIVFFHKVRKKKKSLIFYIKLRKWFR